MLKTRKSQKGFTLIELTFAITIMAVLLAIIIPLAQTVLTNRKYQNLEFHCNELASFANEWAEKEALSQNDTRSRATIDNYLSSLTGIPAAATSYPAAGTAQWIADQAASSNNWNVFANGGFGQEGGLGVLGRCEDPGIGITCSTTPPAELPEITVQGFMPPEKQLLNPFNDLSVFAPENDPNSAGHVVEGAVACATFPEGGGTADEWHLYAFLYQGVDSTTYTDLFLETTFREGYDISLSGLRKGVFIKRIRPGYDGT